MAAVRSFRDRLGSRAGAWLTALAVLCTFVLTLGANVSAPIADAGSTSTNSYLAFQVQASPDPVTAGQQVTWTFSLTNVGYYNDYWVWGGVTYGSISGLPSGCTLSKPATTTGWSQDSYGDWYIAVGKTATLTCTATAPSTNQTVNATVSGMYYDYSGSAYSIGSLSASETLTVASATSGGSGGVQGSDRGWFTLEKTASSYSLTAPGKVTYTYTVTKKVSTPQTLWFTSLKDDKCTSVTYQSGGYQDAYGQRYLYYTGDTMVFTCTQSLSATTTNTATAVFEDSYGNTDTAVATARVGVATGPDLSVTKAANTAAVGVGDTVTYTIDVTNVGTATSQTWTLTDAVPSGFTSVATTTAGCTVSGNTVTCSNQTGLTVGSKKTITITAKATTAGATTNTASVTTTGDLVTANNSASAAVQINAAADLTVTKTADPATVPAGGKVTFTINVKNSGGTASSTWTLTDPVPAGFTSVATTTTGCTVSGNTVTCAAQASLAAGATKTITITANAPTTLSSYTNTATVSGTTNEASTTNNAGSATVTVAAASSDYTVTKTASKSSIALGEAITWTIVVKNSGNVTGSSYSISDTVPSGFNTIIASGCTMAGQTVTCAGSALAPGATQTFTISAKAGNTAGDFVNTVNVTGTTGESSTTNNTATSPVTITPQASGSSGGPVTSSDGRITVTKTASKYLLNAGGETVTYTYTVKNNSGRYMYYSSLYDDKCGYPRYVSGMSGYYTNYIAPGGTATFTCTMPVTQNTTNTVDAVFYSYDVYGYYSYSTASATATVNVKTTTGAGYEGDWCSNVMWSQSGPAGNVSGLGYFAPTPGSGTVKWDANYPTNLTTYNDSAGIATSPLDPGYVYYTAQPNYLSANSAGIYKVDVATGAATLVVAASPTGTTINDLAARTNRMAFDAQGTLWSFATNGHIYSLAKGSTTWVDHGIINVPAEANLSQYGITSFASVQLGDIAFDGLGNMWVMGTSGSSNLFTISAATLASSTPSSPGTATFVGQTSTGGGFYGLAFGPDGTLYASHDSDNGYGEIYSVSTTDGSAKLVITTTTTLGYVQDLGSCALPKPQLVATKTVSPDGLIKPGQELTYTIAVQNIGNLEATGVNLSDSLPAGTTYVRNSTTLNTAGVADTAASPYFPYSPPGQLINSPGAFDGVIAKGATATVTFKVTAGSTQVSVCNQGLVTFVGADATGVKSDDPNRPGAEDPTCNLLAKPGIQVDKSVRKASDPDSAAKPADTMADALVVNQGDQVVYVYKVSIPEGFTEPLKPVTLGDDKLGPIDPVMVPADPANPNGAKVISGDLNNNGTLEPGETWLYYSKSTTMTADVTNIATATGTGTVTGQKVSDTDPANVKVLTPFVNVVKTAGTVSADVDPTGLFTVTYKVTVTNSGQAAATYGPITDTLAFDPNLTPVDASWQLGSVKGAPILFSGAPYTFTVGQANTPLAAGATDTYTITVHFRSTGSVPASECDGTAGHGLYNSVTLPNENGPTTDNSVCAPPPPPQKVTVVKQGVNCDASQPTCLLNGAEFQLLLFDPATSTWQPGPKLTSGNDGLATFDQLMVGRTYQLIETKSPSGFQLLPAPIEFQVTSTGVVLDTVTWPQGLTVTADSFTVTVNDTSNGDLPKAGGRGPWPFVAGGVLLMALAVVHARKTSPQTIARRR